MTRAPLTVDLPDQVIVTCGAGNPKTIHRLDPDADEPHPACEPATRAKDWRVKPSDVFPPSHRRPCKVCFVDDFLIRSHYPVEFAGKG